MSDFFEAIVDEPGLAPRRATKYSAGIDFFSPRDLEILPGTMQVVSTGYGFRHIFSGYGMIADRSSNYMKGVRVFRGVIDGDYRGEIIIVLENFSSSPVKFDKDTVVAQMLLQEISWLTERVKPQDKIRGTGGFGSTVRI